MNIEKKKRRRICIQAIYILILNAQKLFDIGKDFI